MLSAAALERTYSFPFLHVFAGDRLQAFSDAVFAIIATFMVIPLKLDHTLVEEKGGVQGFNLRGFLWEQWARYIIYIYSFSLVVDTWYSHAGIFSLVEQVDDVIIWLNLLCLLLVGFLPYGTGLVSSYPTSANGEHLAITICTLDLVLIGVVMVIILLYIFKKQSLLHPEIENNPDLKSIRRASVISILVTPCMALLALVFSFLTSTPIISLLLFYSIGTASFITRILIYQYYKSHNMIRDVSRTFFKSITSKCRTEAFSDGIYSIVATLLVLDLTMENIPTSDDVKSKFDGKFHQAMYAQRFVFMAYVLSFTLVGLLWFVHYGMMHFIEKLTPSLSIVNMTTLLLIGGIPFVSGVNTIFSDSLKDDELNINETVSIRSLSVLLFLLGVGQLLFWTLAICQKESCMTREIDRNCSETLQFCKIMVFPIVSSIIFWGTFSEQFLYHRVYAMLLFATPFVFLILKGIFRKHGCFRTNRERIRELLSQKMGKTIDV